MFLVDDDEAQVLDGGEDGAAGPDDDVGPALGDVAPLAMPLGVGQRAVQDRHVREPLAEPADGLRRQGDLGHQDDRLPPGRHHFLDRPQVNLGLAAARNAIEDDDAERVGRQQSLHALEGERLLGRQVNGLGLFEFDEEVAGELLDLTGLDPDQALRFQALDDRNRASGLPGQFARRQRHARLGHLVQDAPLLRQDPVDLGLRLLGPHHQLHALEAGAPLDGRRQDRLEHLAQGRHVVAAHPDRQVQKVGRQQRLGVDDLDDRLDLFEVGRLDAADRPAGDHAVALAEGDEQPLARPHLAAHRLGHGVGKDPVQAEGQRDGHKGRSDGIGPGVGIGRRRH